MRRVRELSLIFAVVTAAHAAIAAPNDTCPTFECFVQALWPDAQARGVSQGVFDAAVANVSPDPQILALANSAPEYVRPAGVYIASRISASMIAAGRQHAARLSHTLDRIERQYGVEREILVSVWAIESGFGAVKGKHDVIRALATLAHARFRGDDFFRDELLHALAILQAGDVPRARLVGSWAGAMGQPQFLPSSFLKHAIDGSGDGRRDIWTNEADVLASIANYMASNGWVNGESWGRRVKLPPDFDARLGAKAPLRTEGCRAVRQLTEPMLLSDWRAVGVRTAKGAVLPKAAIAASLLRVDQETFLVYRNYETLLTYNCAHSYAIAVGLLADRLDGRLESWPAAKKAARPAKHRATSGSSHRRSR